MITARKGNYAALTLFFCQVTQGVIPATELESTHTLEVLTLDEGGDAQFFVQLARCHDRSSIGDTVQNFRGFYYVRKFRQH